VRRRILVVEDSKADIFLIRRPLAANEVNANLDVVSDGHSATQFFDSADADDGAPRPDLVLLDLNLPSKNGDEILKHLRKSTRCRHALVLVMTSSYSERDREILTGFAVSEYFRKQSVYEEFMKLGGMVRRLLETG
jgi:CheY-like chemotaxis protein